MVPMVYQSPAPLPIFSQKDIVGGFLKWGSRYGWFISWKVCRLEMENWGTPRKSPSEPLKVVLIIEWSKKIGLCTVSLVVILMVNYLCGDIN